MTNEQQMVVEFTKKFDLDYSNVHTVPSLRISALRISLITEELTELRKAFETNDLIGVADGLGDLLYVTYGTAISCGIEMNDLSPYLPVDPPQFPRDWLADSLLERIAVHVKRLEVIFLSLSTYSTTDILHRLEDIRYDIYLLAYFCGMDLAPIFEEIHRSNMTKEGGNKRKDGKLLKSAAFIPPDLKKVLSQQAE